MPNPSARACSGSDRAPSALGGRGDRAGARATSRSGHGGMAIGGRHPRPVAQLRVSRAVQAPTRLCRELDRHGLGPHAWENAQNWPVMPACSTLGGGRICGPSRREAEAFARRATSGSRDRLTTQRGLALGRLGSALPSSCCARDRDLGCCDQQAYPCPHEMAPRPHQRRRSSHGARGRWGRRGPAR